MSAVSDKVELTKGMVAFWASAFDAMLQDFQRLMLDPEATKRQKAVATSKVAQISILAFQWFNAGLTGIKPTEEDKASCLKACEKVKDMCEKHIDDLDRNLDPEPITERNGSRLN